MSHPSISVHVCLFVTDATVISGRLTEAAVQSSTFVTLPLKASSTLSIVSSEVPHASALRDEDSLSWRSRSSVHTTPPTKDRHSTDGRGDTRRYVESISDY